MTEEKVQRKINKYRANATQSTVSRQFHGEKKVILIRRTAVTGYPHEEKKKDLDPYLSPCTDTNLIFLIDKNTKPRTIYFPRRKYRRISLKA